MNVTQQTFDDPGVRQNDLWLTVGGAASPRSRHGYTVSRMTRRLAQWRPNRGEIVQALRVAAA